MENYLERGLSQRKDRHTDAEVKQNKIRIAKRKTSIM